MPFGVTSDGFNQKLFEDIVAEISDGLRTSISANLDLSERSVLGNAMQVFAEQAAEIWFLAAEAYHAYDVDNATGDRLRALALLLGVTPLGATNGEVLMDLTSTAVWTAAAAGDVILQVASQPTNLWTNTQPIPAQASGVHTAVPFESVEAGSTARAEAGTITVITSAPSGLNTATNPSAAVPGTDVETDEALRLRMRAAVSAPGSVTAAAVLSDVSAIEGVLSVQVLENETAVTDANGLPGHSFMVVVWDGISQAADNTAIADIILATTPLGIQAQGSVEATGTDGQVTRFQRAAQVTISVQVTVESVGATLVSATELANALVAYTSTLAPGDEVSVARLGAIVLGVTNVADYTGLGVRFGTSGAYSTSNLELPGTAVAILSTSDVSVLGDAA